MKPRLLSLALLLAPLLRAGEAWPLPAAEPATLGVAPARLEVLHRNLRQLVDEGRFSGYVVLLARDGRVVDSRAHGWRDLDRRRPMQADTIVRIYSMTKVVTSVAALILLEDGRLQLGDPVGKFLPALARRPVLVGGTADQPELVPATRRATVRDLLRHTSGDYYDETWSADSSVAIELFRRADPWSAPDLDEFIARVARLPLHEEPGTRYRYGLGTDILGALVEKAAGQPLDRFLAERIFVPLQMHDTGFRVPPGKRDRLAIAYERQADGRLVPAPAKSAAEPDDGLFFSGGGGLFSTAGDYLRFAQMLLNGGELDGRRVLSRKSVELMTQNHLSDLPMPHPFGNRWRGFGLGVDVLTNLGASPVLGSPGAFGWDGAATTLFRIDPRERSVAILLTQHFPWNQGDVFATFLNGWYASLED